MSLFDKVLSLLGARRPAIEERVRLASEAMQIAKKRALIQAFMPETREIELTRFSGEMRIELGTARTEKLIWDRPFKSLFVTQLKPLPGDTHVPIAYFRLNSASSSIYQIRTGYIRGNFQKIYLTNAVQTDAWFKFVVSSDRNAEFQMLGEADKILEQIMGIKGDAGHKTLWDICYRLDLSPKVAQIPTIYNVTMTNADTEYDQLLPDSTKIVKANLADNAAFRYAWETGKVAAPTAPYRSQPANVPLELERLNLSAKTLYFADPVGTKVMTIECFV